VLALQVQQQAEITAMIDVFHLTMMVFVAMLPLNRSRLARA